MVKGRKNIRLNNTHDICKAYSKIFQQIYNDEIDNTKARLLLAYLNGLTQAYRSLILEEECDDLKEMIEQINNERTGV